MATALVSSAAGYACPACGDRVADLGDACHGCGATLGLERSVVEVWRGYTTATFIARSGDELVAESPSFRCRGKQISAESPAAQSALEALTSELAELGWSAAADDGGPAWYELAFDRLTAVEVVEAEDVVEEEPEPEHAEPVAAPVPRQQVRRLPPQLPVELAPVTVEPARRIPAAVELPPPAKAPRTRGGRFLTLVSVSGIGVACILGYVIAHRSTRVETRVITVTQPAKAAPAAVSKPPAVVPAAPRPTPVRVAVTARQDTWLELRRGSKSGPVLYSGILPSGRRIHVAGPRVWAFFAAAGNAAVTVDGKPLALTGTLEHLFAAGR